VYIQIVGGSCFDIGNTVREALESFGVSGQPFSGSLSRSAAGNGSLMRLAPIPLYFYPNVVEVLMPDNGVIFSDGIAADKVLE
jgi:ADP-ribosylglycohydrolase